MNKVALEVLLVEDNLTFANLLQELVNEANGSLPRFPPFRLTRASHLAEGLQRLADHAFDLIVLDLNLPDSDGLETFLSVSRHNPDTPIVVLTAQADEELAMSALQAGAQDYLFKGSENPHPILNAMRFAVERHRLLRELRELSLIDALTGVNNRRGFFALADQQMRLAIRNKQKLILLYADLDNLKEINDNHGHLAGDQALRDLGTALRFTFRDSDVLARLGGDEFAVLAIGAPENTARFLVGRLEATLLAHRVQVSRPYALTVSVGVAHFDWAAPVTIDALLAQADRAMYETKRAR